MSRSNNFSVQSWVTMQRFIWLVGCCVWFFVSVGFPEIAVAATTEAYGYSFTEAVGRAERISGYIRTFSGVASASAVTFAGYKMLFGGADFKEVMKIFVAAFVLAISGAVGPELVKTASSLQ